MGTPGGCRAKEVDRVGTTWYVEHRNVKTQCFPCDDPRRFADRAERLERLGERGEVVLIEAATKLVLIRRELPGIGSVSPASIRTPQTS
jgi:hypothetical protein